MSSLQPSALEQERKEERNRPKRVRIGDYEVDYVSDDVTVRHFVPTPVRHQRVGDYEVDYISDDVTVRHLSPKPAVLNGER
jgi:hypothetical protein